MTQQQLEKAARMLMNSKQLTGGDEPKFLPKIYVVNGKCSLFLNAARREAYGTTYPIEVMTIEEAWAIVHAKDGKRLDPKEVEDNFDTVGSTYEGRLFCDQMFIVPGMVPNPVIKYVDGMPELSAVADMPINRMFLGVRAQNILMKTGCKTYGDALKYGRENISKLRNVGATTISELDAEFDRVGLWNQWKFNKPIA